MHHSNDMLQVWGVMGFVAALAIAGEVLIASGMRDLGDLDRMRDFYERGLEAATEIGLVEGQLWGLFGLAVVEAEVGQARIGARLYGRMKELKSHLGAANVEQDVVERQTLVKLEAELGPELLASELTTGAAMSLEDAIDLALGRDGSAAAG